MKRSRVMVSLLVAFVVLLAAAGIFLVQSVEDSRMCAGVVAPDVCALLSPMSTAATAVYASVAGLAFAVLLAAGVGFKIGITPPPNAAMARALDDDEHNLEAYQARRAQLDDWTIAAQARAAEAAARAEEAARREAEAEEAFEAEAARWIQEETGEEEEQESESAKRSRVLAEHLAHLARARPEAVAAVLSGWINQQPRR